MIGILWRLPISIEARVGNSDSELLRNYGQNSGEFALGRNRGPSSYLTFNAKLNGGYYKVNALSILIWKSSSGNHCPSSGNHSCKPWCGTNPAAVRMRDSCPAGGGKLALWTAGSFWRRTLYARAADGVFFVGLNLEDCGQPCHLQEIADPVVQVDQCKLTALTPNRRVRLNQFAQS